MPLWTTKECGADLSSSSSLTADDAARFCFTVRPLLFLGILQISLAFHFYNFTSQHKFTIKNLRNSFTFHVFLRVCYCFLLRVSGKLNALSPNLSLPRHQRAKQDHVTHDGAGRSEDLRFKAMPPVGIALNWREEATSSQSTLDFHHRVGQGILGATLVRVIYRPSWLVF